MLGKKGIAGAIALTMAAVATPAQADIFSYTMSNGSVLSINNETNTATFVGNNINTSMTSDAFATFAGGANPVFTAVLSSLDGTRLVNGQWLTDNPYLADSTHPQKLIMESTGRVNLWAWWGNPISAGDYITYVTSYSVSTSGGTQVPEPGMLGLFGLAAAGVMFGRRRRKAKVTYSNNMAAA
ncbi:MAG: PEP-CTERM sorting domain-containing protein [Sphingomonadaceae bacterium]|nr:PEP-CTERM sorting domain-containing protein [Sphingomonadaceae bacterium]